MNLECRALGRHWHDNRPAVGIVDSELPRGYYQPREAWDVDLDSGAFKKAAPYQVICARFSDSGD